MSHGRATTLRRASEPVGRHARSARCATPPASPGDEDGGGRAPRGTAFTLLHGGIGCVIVTPIGAGFLHWTTVGARCASGGMTMTRPIPPSDFWFKKLDVYIIACRALTAQVVQLRLADARLRDQATRAASRCFSTLVRRSSCRAARATGTSASRWARLHELAAALDVSEPLDLITRSSCPGRISSRSGCAGCSSVS